MDLFSIWHLLVILLIVVVLFGTSKLRNIGSDLGGAIKTFRQSMKDEVKKDDQDESDESGVPVSQLTEKKGRVIEGTTPAAAAAKGPSRVRRKG